MGRCVVARLRTSIRLEAGRRDFPVDGSRPAGCNLLVDGGSRNHRAALLDRLSRAVAFAGSPPLCDPESLRFRSLGRDREGWDRLTVGEVMEPCSPSNTISRDANAVDAMMQMQRTGNSRLLVVDRGRLSGGLSLSDMLQFLSLKLEFGEVGA